jgi:hypothetical protein
VQKVPIKFEVQGGNGTIKVGDAGFPESQALQERVGRDADARFRGNGRKAATGRLCGVRPFDRPRQVLGDAP